MKKILQNLKYKKGFTLLELVMSMALISILAAAATLYLHPLQNKQQARDNARLATIAELERVVNEYMLDTRGYPGDSGVAYMSDYPNWLPLLNMPQYTSRIPIDPLNKGEYFYYYKTDGVSYEINATLEFFPELMQKDGGDNDDKYEVGNNLTLLP